MRTPDQVIQWAKDHPKNPYSGGPSWNNDCVQFIWGSGNFPVGNSASTAQRAADLTLANRHRLDRDTPYSKIPKGHMVYFSGPTAAGHMGMSTGGGNFLSATTRFEMPNALGIMPISRYAGIPNVRYIGSSPYFVNLTLNLTEPSSEDSQPIEESIEEMAQGNLIRNSSTGTIYWEREPGAALFALTSEQFQQASSGGNTYIDFSNTTLAAWIASVGVVTNPALAVRPQPTVATGSFTATDRTTLNSLATGPQIAGLQTAAANQINSHTATKVDAAKNDILAAIDEIPGGTAPQNLTVTLTGTAEAAQ